MKYLLGVLCGALLFCRIDGVSSADRFAEAASESAAFTQKVIELTNAERVAHGLLPLKRQADLTASAAWLAQDMAAHDYFDHTDRQGRSIDPRLPDFGYSGYHFIGENIAAGQPTPANVVAGWMKSPGHRANILHADFREIGVGYFTRRGSKFRRYWVQDFGARRDVYPVVINNEAAQTRRAAVTLAIYGEGWARQMRLRNADEAWTVWEPFRAHRDWNLTPGKGPRTVAVEIRRDDETRQASDSIELLPDQAEDTGEQQQRER